MLSLIAALSTNHVIGQNNQLPWHLPADLKHFKDLTLNKPIVMGRKTFESIGRPLPNRRNIVVSQQSHLEIPGCEIYASIDDALTATQHEAETMIIGGGAIYAQTLDKADKMYLTLVDTQIKGDAFFPTWSNAWQIVEEIHHQKDNKNPFNYTFLTLVKK